MKHYQYLLLAIFCMFSFSIKAQYTDVINSNRPGVSISAYSVGKNVIQGEFGFVFERTEHDGLLEETTDYGLDYVIRYGLWKEQLELFFEGTYISQNFERNRNFLPSPLEINRRGFSRNAIGFKYLIFDPYKNAANEEPNLYSWKANNSFKWKDLIPAISIIGAANITLSTNVFIPNEPIVSPRIGVAAQSHVSGRWVLVGNIIYDRITSDDPILSYVITVTHNLKNPKWSLLLENQGINSDAFSDISLRGGIARLINKNFQVDASAGINFKNTPSRIFGTFGVSYRLDYHKDELKAIEPTIKKPKKRYKKKKRKKSKNKDEKSDDSDESNALLF